MAFLSASSIDGSEKSDYFSSSNCRREFRHAVKKGKPIVFVLETDPQHGGSTLEIHRAACPPELLDAFDGIRVVRWYRQKDFLHATLCLILQVIFGGPGSIQLFSSTALQKRARALTFNLRARQEAA